MRKRFFTITSMKRWVCRDNYMVILFLGVLHNYIITIIYQQSREQKRVGGQLAPGANSPRSPLLKKTSFGYMVVRQTIISVFWLPGNFFDCPGCTENQNFERWWCGTPKMLRHNIGPLMRCCMSFWSIMMWHILKCCNISRNNTWNVNCWGELSSYLHQK